MVYRGTIDKEWQSAAMGIRVPLSQTLFSVAEVSKQDICVYSVSFRDGHKFRNSIEQHRELREISDAICKEHGLSVLADAPFYGGQSKGAYWKEKKGQPTHRQQLKEDIEYCLRYSSNWEQFIRQLNAKGYSFDPTRVSVKADDWQRAVRLDRLGYPDDYLDSFCEQGSACGNHNRDHRTAEPCQACPAHPQGHAAPAESAQDGAAGRI